LTLAGEPQLGEELQPAHRLGGVRVTRMTALTAVRSLLK
jgi:hypothetical protein